MSGVADDLALALELADAADEITMPLFRDTRLVIDTKPDMTPVTEADRGVERVLRDVLGGRRPDDAVLGEQPTLAHHQMRDTPGARIDDHLGERAEASITRRAFVNTSVYVIV